MDSVLDGAIQEELEQFRESPKMNAANPALEAYPHVEEPLRKDGRDTRIDLWSANVEIFNPQLV